MEQIEGFDLAVEINGAAPMSNIRHVLTLGLFVASLAALSAPAFAGNSDHTHHKHTNHAGSVPSPGGTQKQAPCGTACGGDDTQGGSAY